MKIELYSGDERIAECDWVDGLPEDGDFLEGHLIRLINVRCKNATKIKKGHLIDICYQLNGFALSSSSVEIATGFSLHDSRNISFFAFGAVVFDLLKIKLISAWASGEDPVLFGTLNERQRRSWLNALYAWNQVISRPSVISSEKILIPINLISSRVDLYVLLGSTIFGEKGYFGQSLDAFEECAKKYLSNSNEKSRFSFIFHGGSRAILSAAIGDEYLGTLEKILLELKIDFIYEGE